MGLFREGFLLGGEAEDCELGDRVGEADFLRGNGIGRTIVTGLTAVGDWEPWDV